MPTLVLTSRTGADTQRLWRAAIDRGWNVDRHRGPMLPDSVGPPPYALDTEALDAPHLAQQLGVTLIEPPLDWLARAPANYTQRWVRLTTMGQARTATTPQFAKPPNDKSFEARVYPTGLDLPSDPPDDAPVLVADPVTWTVEFRCFVRDRRVVTLSPYLRGGILLEQSGFAAESLETENAVSFAERLLGDVNVELPNAIVMDVGHILDRGWAVIELNAATSSGIYGCDANAVLDVLQLATIPAN